MSLQDKKNKTKQNKNNSDANTIASCLLHLNLSIKYKHDDTMNVTIKICVLFVDKTG